MCGIAGFVNQDGAPADEGALGTMTDLIRHRGPDDRGTLCISLRGGVADTALGFQRLKILDLSARGHQPMTSPDGSMALLFNGEIYNAFDLRPALERAGYRFRSATDSEVVLALYAQHGLEDTLERLEGMFAFVLADTRRGVVHLVRDRVGIKPLYWTRCGASVLFASEAKAFFAFPAFRAGIDPEQLDELLAFRYVASGASLLKGVRQIEPGSYLTVTPDGITGRRYWQIPDAREKSRLSRDEAVDRLHHLLDRSVQSQLRADVKVGCQLSGGIDSSLIALLARGHQDALDACSIVFEETQFSEARWIDEAAEAAYANSLRFEFGADTFIDALDAVSWHMDQPIGHPNALALWWLARSSRERATVLLTGEGCDELFGGYRRALAAHAAADAPAVNGAADPVDAFIRATQFHPPARLSRLRPGADLRPALEKRRALFDEGQADHLSNCLRYDIRTHLAELLIRQDKMMMAHGVENRVPFLDGAVIEFARALPAEHLVGETVARALPETKTLVKALARRSFSEPFVSRRKAGFNLPLAQYFRHPRFVALMEDRLLPGMAARGIVDVKVVRRWWRRALSAPSTTEGFWIPVSLELWAQQCVDGRGRATSPQPAQWVRP